MADDLNPGIRRTVALLREYGFETVDSGDGETHDHACDRSYGYVSILVQDHHQLVNEASRLRRVLQHRGLTVAPVGNGNAAWIQATFDPSDGTAILDVQNIHDRMLRDLKIFWVGWSIKPDDEFDNARELPCGLPGGIEPWVTEDTQERVSFKALVEAVDDGHAKIRVLGLYGRFADRVMWTITPQEKPVGWRPTGV